MYSPVVSRHNGEPILFLWLQLIVQEYRKHSPGCQTQVNKGGSAKVRDQDDERSGNYMEGGKKHFILEAGVGAE